MSSMKSSGRARRSSTPPTCPPMASSMTLNSPFCSTRLKADLNAYLASRGPGTPMHSLEEIIAFNDQQP